MEKTWDLSILYDGFDDEKYASDELALKDAIASLTTLAQVCDKEDERALLTSYIKTSAAINEYAGKLIIYCNLRYSACTADAEAASNLGKLLGMMSDTAAPMAKISKTIAGIADIESHIAADALLSEHAYLLRNIVRDSKYLLSDGEETVFAKMNISGAQAWEDLHSTLTSGVKVMYDGKEITLSAARNLAYDSDRSVRKSAYEAELACYPGIEDAVAFALNSIKLQVLNECAMRGYESPLAKSLYTSRMKRSTLDALIGAMEEYMPVFRKYLQAKSRALGNEGALPWYDLFAPLGNSTKTYTTEDAKDYLLSVLDRKSVV